SPAPVRDGSSAPDGAIDRTAVLDEVPPTPPSAPDAAAPTVALETEATLRLVDVTARPLVGLRLRKDDGRLVKWSGGDPIWAHGGNESLRIPLADQRRLREDAAFAEEFLSQRSLPEEWRSKLFGTPQPEVEVTSGGVGELPFDIDQALDGVAVVEPGWTLLGLATEAGAEEPSVLVAAPAVQLAGRVTDPDGRGLSRVRARLAPDARSKIDATCSGLALSTLITPPEIYSMPDGGFALRDVPALPGVEFELSVDGYRTLRLPVPSVDNHELEVVLQAEDAPPLTFEGQVVAAGGGPVAGATVFLGANRLETDAQGRFRFELGELAPDATLAVVAAPWQAVHEPNFGRELLADPGNNGVRTIVLDRLARTLRGRVVDGNGVALDGVSLNLFDPDLPGTGFSTLERMAGERDRQVQTDATGAFELPGLSTRAYRLRVFDRDRSLFWVSDPIAADAEYVELTVPAAARRTIRGQVVDADGNGLADARVVVIFRTFVNFSGYGTMNEICDPVACDADGTFVLEGVPLEHATVGVEVEGLGQAAVPVEFVRDGELVVELPSPRAVRVRVERFREGDVLQVRDVAGRLERPRAFGSAPGSGDLGPSVAPGSDVRLMLSGKATEVQLVREGVVIDRAPVPNLEGRVGVVTLGSS
ncbi:MAG: carboxypeptidase-like regulatory domain-containing protein, partial [Planctomycetota bacterium]